MSKKYNLSSSSDMRRFSRDLKKSVLDMTRDSVNSMEFDIECPHCNSTVSMHSGLNICPFCQKEVNVKLNADI